MSIVKISFLLRTISARWDYKEATSRDFWEDLTEKLESSLNPVKPLRQPKGSVQYHFYVASDSTTDQCRNIAAQVLAAMFPNEDDRKKVILSVTEPDGDELSELKKSCADSLDSNPQFWQEAEKMLNSIS